MRSPKHALLYGLGVWVGLVVISLVLLPFEEGGSAALYESVKATALVAVVLGFVVRYSTANSPTTATEGVIVGVLWAVITIGLDLVLYAAGAFTIGLGEYFTDVASSYLVIPVVTTVTLGFLRRK